MNKTSLKQPSTFTSTNLQGTVNIQSPIKKQKKFQVIIAISVLLLISVLIFSTVSNEIKTRVSYAVIADYNFTKTIDGKVIQVEMGLAAGGEPSSSNYGSRNLILTDAGSVYVWGTTAAPSAYTSNTNTSNVSSTNILAKVNIPTDDGKVVAISVGTYTMYALTENGSVYAWGVNFAGECGDGLYGFGTGTINNSSQTSAVRTQSTPKKIAALSNIVQVLAQPEGAMALDANGDVWAWGRASAIRCFTSSTPDVLQYMTQRTGHYCMPTPQKVITGENLSRLIYNYVPGAYMLGVNDDFSKILGWGALSGAEKSGLATSGTLASSNVPTHCDILEEADIKEYKNSAYVDNNNNVFARVCGGTNWRYEKVAELPNDYIDWTIKEVASATELIGVVNPAYQTSDGIWYAKVPGGAQPFMFGFPTNCIIANFNQMNFMYTPAKPMTDMFGFKHSSYNFIRGYTSPMAASMVSEDGSFHLVGKFISGNDTYNPKFQTIAGSMLFGAVNSNWFEIFAYNRDNADALLSMGVIKASTGNITFRFKVGGAKITKIRLINNATQSVLNIVNNPTGETPEDAVLSNLAAGTYRIEVTNLDGETNIRDLIINKDVGGRVIDADFGFEIPDDSTYPGSIKFEIFDVGTAVTATIGSVTTINYSNEVFSATTTSTKYTIICTSVYGKKTTHVIYLLKNFMGDDATEPDITIDSETSDLVMTDKYNYKSYTSPQISWTHPNIIGVALDNSINFAPFSIEEYGMHDLEVVYFKNSINKGELDTYKINIDYLNEIKAPDQIDKTVLTSLYNTVKDKYDSKFYTESSYNLFKASLDFAKEIIDKDNATEAEAQSAYDDLVAGVISLDLQTTNENVTPNKTILQDLYDKAIMLTETDYTQNSYSVLASAISTAEDIFDNQTATQLQIDETFNILLNAILGLQSNTPTSKTALNAIYTSFLEADRNNYTSESYSNLVTYLTAAQEVLENDTATQSEIDNVLTYLVDAIKALELESYIPTSTTTLKSVYDELITLNNQEYTAESFAAFTSTLTSAEETLVNQSATQSQIDNALTNLVTAALGLQTKIVTNKTILQTIYDDYADTDENKYTQESYTNFIEYLTTTEEILEDSSATQLQINIAVIDLIKAIVGLQLNYSDSPDLVELQIAYNEFTNVNKDNYTAESYDELAEELSAVKLVIDNKLATQEQIDKAFVDLIKTAARLEPKITDIDKTALATIITDAQNIADTKGGKAELTQSSYETLIEAIRHAQEVLSSESTTTDGIEFACSNLLNAVSNLKLKTNTSLKDQLPILIGGIGIVLAFIMFIAMVSARKRKTANGLEVNDKNH